MLKRASPARSSGAAAVILSCTAGDYPIIERHTPSPAGFVSVPTSSPPITVRVHGRRLRPLRTPPASVQQLVLAPAAARGNIEGREQCRSSVPTATVESRRERTRAFSGVPARVAWSTRAVRSSRQRMLVCACMGQRLRQRRLSARPPSGRSSSRVHRRMRGAVKAGTGTWLLPRPAAEEG